MVLGSVTDDLFCPLEMEVEIGKLGIRSCFYLVSLKVSFVFDFHILLDSEDHDLL